MVDTDDDLDEPDLELDRYIDLGLKSRPTASSACFLLVPVVETVGVGLDIVSIIRPSSSKKPSLLCWLQRVISQLWPELWIEKLLCPGRPRDIRSLPLRLAFVAVMS